MGEFFRRHTLLLARLAARWPSHSLDSGPLATPTLRALRLTQDVLDLEITGIQRTGNGNPVSDVLMNYQSDHNAQLQTLLDEATTRTVDPNRIKDLRKKYKPTNIIQKITAAMSLYWRATEHKWEDLLYAPNPGTIHLRPPQGATRRLELNVKPSQAHWLHYLHALLSQPRDRLHRTLSDLLTAAPEHATCRISMDRSPDMACPPSGCPPAYGTSKPGHPAGLP